MGNDEHIYDNGIWFARMSQLPEIISSVVTSWMKDEIPHELTDAMEKTSELYRYKEWDENIDRIFNELIDERIKEITAILESVKEKNNNKKEE